MKKIDVKVIRGYYKELEKQLFELMNDGYELSANVVIAPDDYLYAVLTKKLD